MPDPSIELSDVTRRFGEVVAVDALDLTVRPGEVVGLLGPNGAGKSTAIRMVLGMLMPSEGRVRVLGGPPNLKVRRHIGYLPEQRGLYEKMSALDQLDWFARLHGLPKAEARSRSERWLDRLGLHDRVDDALSEYSKGMQQRVQLGVALVHEPPIVVLDEPFSGLDPVSQDVFSDVVEDERARGAAVLLCTHDLDHAQRSCDRVVVIIKGRKQIDAEVASLRREAGRGRLTVGGPGVDTLLRTPEVVHRIPVDDGWIVQLAEHVDARWLLERLLAADVVPERFERAEPTLHEIVVRRIRDWVDEEDA